jgi:hypothetical protein
MTKILNSGLALILLACGSASAFADEDLYISDANGKLGYVDLTTDHVTVLGSSGVVLHDIGFTSNGNIYGDTFTELYSINVLNGAATPMGSFGGAGNNQMVGLVGDGSGLIGASSGSSKLYAIDVSPFSVSALSGSLAGATNGDVTFGVNGELYDILSNGNLDKVTIVGNTFTQTVIGNTNNKSISGMATESNGTVLAIAGTEVYVVDTQTAQLTPLLNYGGQGLGTVTGAAIFTTVAVPEPGSVALLLAGVAGLVFYQKRRRLAASNIA